MQMAVRGGELVGQVARQRSAFGQEAMLADDRTQTQDWPGAGEAGLGIAIARDMQMHAMRARRQAAEIELHQHAAIDGGEGDGPGRLAVQQFQMRNGARLGRCGQCQKCERGKGQQEPDHGVSLRPSALQRQREEGTHLP